MAAVDAVAAYLSEVPGLEARRLAHGEWGLTVPGENVGGDPIEASLRISDGLLRVQAIALHAASDLDPWMLLWWNRQTRLVRFGCTRSHSARSTPPGRSMNRRRRSGPALSQARTSTSGSAVARRCSMSV